MKLITLNRGFHAIVDDEDFERLSQWKWYAKKCGGAFYASRHLSNIRMHRVILNLGPREVSDHINGDTLDNRKSNLRKCTRAENGINRKVYRNNQSGFKGVSFESARGKWKAEVYVKNNLAFWGRFDSARNAALAYNEAALIHHGVFARLNEVPIAD